MLVIVVTGETAPRFRFLEERDEARVLSASSISVEIGVASGKSCSRLRSPWSCWSWSASESFTLPLAKLRIARRLARVFVEVDPDDDASALNNLEVSWDTLDVLIIASQYHWTLTMHAKMSTDA